MNTPRPLAEALDGVDFVLWNGEVFATEYARVPDEDTREDEHRLLVHELAHALHVSGYRVAKAVVVECDGRMFLAVLPASDRVDLVKRADIAARGLDLRREVEEGRILIHYESPLELDLAPEEEDEDDEDEDDLDDAEEDEDEEEEDWDE